ncbi:MAG TPA: glycosyltransferase family 4 protein [Rubrivivax sp.]|nr:glycosyltransferase family 4 protein [Rubrivivax sp.]
MTFHGLSIALVGPLPPPAGGMANQTRQLAELLQGEGARVELVQTNVSYRPAWVEQVRGLRALARLLPYLRALWRAAGRNDLMHLMANSGWSWHLFAAPAIGVARLRGLPVVVNYRGGEAEVFLQRSARYVRAGMRRAAALVVPSGFLQEVFARHRMPARVVPNVVDLQRFRPAEHRGEQARGDAPPRILVARNLEAIYDNATALRAFALVLQARPKARLLVAGTGPEEAALRALAAELGIAAQVEFRGRLDRDAMAELLRGCSVSLNPSRVDNMPNSVLEALASGVPVVSTDVGGVPHIVADGRTALLVPAGEAQAMAAALLRVLDDPQLAARLREAGLREVQRYTWAQVAPLLGRIYAEACAPAAARRVA